MNIIPTIGRMVLYVPGNDVSNDPFPNRILDKDNTCQPMPAIVCYVYPQTENDVSYVNLSVMDHKGEHHPRTNVALLDADASPPAWKDKTHAHWMPYQFKAATS